MTIGCDLLCFEFCHCALILCSGEKADVSVLANCGETNKYRQINSWQQNSRGGEEGKSNRKRNMAIGTQYSSVKHQVSKCASSNNLSMKQESEIHKTNRDRYFNYILVCENGQQIQDDSLLLLSNIAATFQHWIRNFNMIVCKTIIQITLKCILKWASNAITSISSNIYNNKCVTYIYRGYLSLVQLLNDISNMMDCVFHTQNWKVYFCRWNL